MNAWLFDLLNDRLKTSWLDVVIPWFSDKDLVVIPALVGVVLLLYFGRRHTRTCVLAMVLALAISDWGSEQLWKPLFGHYRPYGVTEVNLHRNGSWIEYKPEWYQADPRRSYGFPSSHASNIAAFAVVLFMLHRRTLWVMGPLALLVGYSRVYTGNHYPLQVLAGYVWGAVAGWLALKAAFGAVRWVKGPPGEPEPREPTPEARLAFYWLLAFWVGGNFLYLHWNGLTLAGDEAQYWDWSRRLALGYYSKPPLVAYVIDIFTGAGGNKEWAIRTPALLLSAGTLALVYALALRILKSEGGALFSTVVALCMPLTWTGSMLMTIDPLLVFFWMWALYAFHRAVSGVQGQWLMLGLALGLGLLAKYTMAVLILFLAIHLVVYGRRWLKHLGPYAALALAMLLQTGVVVWNIQHDWISFRHTANIGAGTDAGLGPAVARLVTFLGGQTGMVSPILFVLLLWGGWRCLCRMRHDKDAAFLLLGCGGLFVFYAAVSLFRVPQVNWPVAAYAAAPIMLVMAWRQRTRGPRARRWLAAGCVLGIALGLVPRATGFVYELGGPVPDGHRADQIHLGKVHIDADLDPTNELRGGKALGAALDKHLTGKDSIDPFLFSNRYQLAAQLAFYAPGRPETFCLPWFRRQNQYDLWADWPALEGKDAIFVTGGGAETAQRWVDGLTGLGLFADGEYLETVEVVRGNTVVRTFTLSRLRNYSGKDLKPRDKY